MDASMVYDAARARIVIFGGRPSIFDEGVDELWEWDGAAGVFTNRGAGAHSATWPAARYSHSAAFDSARGRMIVFGGYAIGNSDDTWEWDGSAGTWTQRATRTVRPRPRQSGGMAFDVARSRAVMAGGTIDVATVNVGTDTWEYDGNQSD